jgi:hypothetical protein
MSYTKHFPDGVFHEKKRSKKCTGVCSMVKPIEEFARKLNALDGHESQCKDCTNARGRMIRERKKENNYNPFI